MRKISTDRLIELLEAENKLVALERGGVYSWDWYYASIEEYVEEFSNGIYSLNINKSDLEEYFPKL